jgi:isocitrate dehydrogenase (NAD+)
MTKKSFFRSSESNIMPHAFAKYGGRYLVTLIPGDGIGREITNSMKKVFSYMNLPVDFDEIHLSGYDAVDTSSKSFNAAVESLKRTKVGIKGKK